MAKFRGIFPLFLATAFGILNGVVIFQPAFADQQKGKLLDEEQKGRETTPPAVPEPIEAPTTPPPAMESAPAQGLAKNEQLPKVLHSERSLWSMMRFWERGASKAEEVARKPTEGVPQEVKLVSDR